MEQKAVERLTIFTDGVMAISITLLVLDLRVPEGAGAMSSAELIDALIELLPDYGAYALSFLVVALFWRSHFEKFRWIRGVSGGLVWLNILFLLTIGLIPFVTGLISETGDTVATVVYAALMAVAGFWLQAIWGYAWARGLIDPAMPTAVVRRRLIRGILMPLVFVLSIPIAFASPDAGRYVWLLLIPISIERTIRAVGGRPADSPPPTAAGADAVVD